MTKPTTDRYTVRTLTSNFRTIREPHQVIDTATHTIVDEYKSKRAATAHAKQLNSEDHHVSR